MVGQNNRTIRQKQGVVKYGSSLFCCFDVEVQFYTWSFESYNEEE